MAKDLSALWVEKYRPQRLKDYIFQNTSDKRAVENMLGEQSIPHLLFSGVQGSGKTTIVRVILNELKLDPTDVLIINASDENSVDVMREKIKSFVTTFAMGPFKVVNLEEADYLSPNAQAVLRQIMEQYSNSCRFVLTCVTGETKVYTPYGYKEIQSASVDDEVFSLSGDLLNVKEIVRNKSEVYQVNTQHGIVINATENHLFHTLHGPKTINDLKTETTPTLLTKISDLYGNSFKHEAVEKLNLDIVNKKQFISFLRQKGFCFQRELHFINTNSNFIFSPTHYEIVNDLVKKNEWFNIVNVSELYDITIAQSRNILHKLKHYVIAQKQKQHQYREYKIDWDKFRHDYVKFIEEYTRTYGSFDNHKLYISWQHRKSKIYIEEFLQHFPEKIDNEMLLTLGRLVGFTNGDGHISNCMCFAANNQQTLQLIKSDLDKIKQTNCKITQNGRKSQGLKIQFSDIILQNIIEFFGAQSGNKTTTEKHLPPLCKESKLFFKGFIQGYFDADAIWTSLHTNQKTLNPITLIQNFTSDTINNDTSFERIKELLHHHFNIKSTIATSELDQSHFRFTCNDIRYVKKLQIIKQTDIKQYLLTIGNYYDKPKSDAYLGYLLYKENCSCSLQQALTFNEWKEKYYIDGFINDTIFNIEFRKEKQPVYDLSFDKEHWYITNGVVSHNCNYENKIIPAIKSRCQHFKFKSFDKDDIAERIAEILVNENIKFTLNDIDGYIAVGYPDIRKIINLLQQNVIDNKLQPVKEAEAGDYKFKLLDLISTDNWLEVRKLLCANVYAEEWEDVYRFLYENLNKSTKFSEPAKWEEGIVIISDHLYRHSLVADPEINAAAMFIRLAQI